MRLYSQQAYGIPPEQVVGSALAVKYDYAKDRNPIREYAYGPAPSSTHRRSNSGPRFRSLKFMKSGNVDLERWYPQWSQSITSDAS